jgi:hypothetical protein
LSFLSAFSLSIPNDSMTDPMGKSVALAADKASVSKKAVSRCLIGCLIVGFSLDVGCSAWRCELKALAASGATKTALAKQFGISRQTLYAYLN